jgi:hypothetical protein
MACGVLDHDQLVLQIQETSQSRCRSAAFGLSKGSGRHKFLARSFITYMAYSDELSRSNAHEQITNVTSEGQAEKVLSLSLVRAKHMERLPGFSLPDSHLFRTAVWAGARTLLFVQDIVSLIDCYIRL